MNFSLMTTNIYLDHIFTIMFLVKKSQDPKRKKKIYLSPSTEKPGALFCSSKYIKLAYQDEYLPLWTFLFIKYKTFYVKIKILLLQ